MKKISRRNKKERQSGNKTEEFICRANITPCVYGPPGTAEDRTIKRKAEKLSADRVKK